VQESRRLPEDTRMTLIADNEIPDLAEGFLSDRAAPERMNWRGRECLRLSGETAALFLLPDLKISRGRIEVEIGAEGTAYPGIVFRAADSLNYELAYAQPHTSGEWDAIQYDPVFHGTNTWQLYHGERYQKAAVVPTGEWFTLGVEFAGRRARIRVGDQPPLHVARLAHPMGAGCVGLWTYKPAYFRNLRVWDDPPDFSAETSDAGSSAPGTVSKWFLEGYGVVSAEPGGIVNLSRYLPVSVREARLVRTFDLPEETDLILRFGFSDEIDLRMDGGSLFTGTNLWHDLPDWKNRGYVAPDRSVGVRLSRGTHRLEAAMKALEYFGFGMILRIEGGRHTLLPAEWTD
jgi:hypothetical protein